MKLPKLKEGDPVIVRWIDTNSPKDKTWQTIDEYKESSAVMEFFSLGFFTEIKDDYLRMSADTSDSDVYVDVIGRMFNIPIGAIKKVKKIKL